MEIRARGAALAHLLTAQYGFRGDAEDYDNPANANLIQVLERRRGLPVALGVLWLHAARAAGWPAHGVDFPAHFLIALEGAGGQLVADVFDGGRVLDAPALRALIKRVAGPEAELRPGLLRPAGSRAVLLRLQNNLRTRRLGAGDVPGALAATLDMLRIAPDQASLWREAGAMHQRLDQIAAALRCFERFLALAPDGPLPKVAQGLIFTLLCRRAERLARAAGVIYNDHLFGLLNDGRLTEAYLLGLVPRLEPGVTEIYCHPGLYADAELQHWAPAYRRQAELTALLSPRLRDALVAAGIELSDFRALSQKS